MSIGFYNGDCMDFMRDKPDGFYDLAIVDPPYGGGGENCASSEPLKVYRTGGTWAAKYSTTIRKWDYAPNKEYFDELFRVSKNQIIWGGTTLNCRHADAS